MDVSLPARTKEASLVHGQTKKLSQRVQGSWSKQCSVLLLGRGLSLASESSGQKRVECNPRNTEGSLGVR